MNLATIKLLFQLGVKNSCVSANMLKINWSVGRRNFFFFFFFFYFFSRKEQGLACNIYKNTGILLRVGALLFYFAFLLIKIAELGF